MINEQLLSATRRMTDSRIKDMIKQVDRYSNEEVQAARIVAQERNLVQDSEDAYTRSALNSTEETPQIPIESEPQPVPVSSNRGEYGKDPKSKGGFSYWWLLFVIYLIVKYGLRAMNN